MEKLAGLASAQAKVGVAMVALECMRLVTGVLGEVPVEALPRLREPVIAQLVCPQACLRYHVRLLTTGMSLVSSILICKASFISLCCQSKYP